MNFPRGILEQKFNVNRACFPKGKYQNSRKWAKFMNFSFWPFLWFCFPGRLLMGAYQQYKWVTTAHAALRRLDDAIHDLPYIRTPP